MKKKCNLRIMIVDDDKDCLTGLHFTLGLFGYTLKTIISPVDAVEEFKKNKTDLVITDYLMPNMNGIELITILRDINPSVKAILITAYGGFPLIKKAINNRIFDIISKPIDINKLYHSIDCLCDEIILEKKHNLNNKSGLQQGIIQVEESDNE